MSDDVIEIVRGSGNLYRDFNVPDPDIRQAKAILAAVIIKTLDARAWSTRKAEEMTGLNHSEFVRIRRANIGRFSIERLASILGLLDQEVEFTVRMSAPASLRPTIPRRCTHERGSSRQMIWAHRQVTQGRSLEVSADGQDRHRRTGGGGARLSAIRAEEPSACGDGCGSPRRRHIVDLWRVGFEAATPVPRIPEKTCFPTPNS